MEFYAGDLEKYIREHIPAGRFMELIVEHLDESSILVTAPLAPNVNDKGSAFGGSLFSLAVLAGWGFTFSLLRNAGLDADVVVQKSEMQFLAQAMGDIQVRCEMGDPDQGRALLERVASGQKGRWDLKIEILSDGKLCASMQARYYGWLKQPPESGSPPGHRSEKE